MAARDRAALGWYAGPAMVNAARAITCIAALTWCGLVHAGGRDRAAESSLTWEALPDLPDAIAVAVPFVGVHKGARVGILAGVGVMVLVWRDTPANGFLYSTIGITVCLVVGYLASFVMPGRAGELEGLTIYTLPKGET